ncbi:hypothetical protein CK500_03510 [Halorubrum salipaludis]|uniref:Uncharacterized protein n=1 Tax=Halorubrum salipaludis TaxID=2032630 RepID=A0A2A2FIW8_9EURY|nr:hypothetical protein [Halorubrum salipaludis]PAU84592.1 hypothetical protein CK500_03510 [Halorubrum salipaludis]
MSPSDDLDEQTVRSIVREELARTTRTLLGTVVWTLISVFTILVGLQLVQLAVHAASIAATGGLLIAGTLIIGASLYLLYLLYGR